IKGAATLQRQASSAFSEQQASTGEPVAQQRRGLGKGLGALIPEAPSTGTGTGTMTGTPAPADTGRPDQRSAAPTPGYEAPETGLRQVAGAYFEEVAVGSIMP